MSEHREQASGIVATWHSRQSRVVFAQNEQESLNKVIASALDEAVAQEVERLREALEAIAELEGDNENQAFRLTRFQAAQIARRTLHQRDLDARNTGTG